MSLFRNLFLGRQRSLIAGLAVGAGACVALQCVRALSSPPPSSIVDSIMAQSAKALASDTIVPFHCKHTIHKGGVMDFVLSTPTQQPKKKKPMNYTNNEAKGKRPAFNPFLPPDLEDDLLVGEFEGYNMILNKFIVVKGHFLLCTKEFESQADPLNEKDFNALWRAVNEVDGLGFFNGGFLAGSSQPHKHMQIIPFTKDSNPARPPMETMALSYRGAHPRGHVERSLPLPFAHSCLYIDRSVPREMMGAWLLGHYRAMMRYHEEAGHVPSDPAYSLSYNLLVTKEVMFFVPRRVDMMCTIPVNSMGYAGYLLVRDQDGLEGRDPMDVVAGCAFPREAK